MERQTYTHRPISCSAETEGANRFGHAVPARPPHHRLMLDAGLVHALRPDHEDGGEVRDVGGGQTEGLDLGQLPVGGLRGYHRPQRHERRVHAVRAIALAGVGGVAGWLPTQTGSVELGTGSTVVRRLHHVVLSDRFVLEECCPGGSVCLAVLSFPRRRRSRR